jgi:hypothetical protein
LYLQSHSGRRKDARVAKSQIGKQRDKTRGGAAVSGLRGLSTGIVGTLFANEVRASAGKAGLAGVAAGLAFNVMLKRSPVGAVLFGSALIAHRAYKAGKDAQAKRDARRALAKGAIVVPADALAGTSAIAA